FSTGTLQPSVVLDQNPAQFLTAARTDTDKIDLFRCTELEKPAAASCVLQSSIGVGFDMAVPPAATQPGGAETLDTLDGRFENRGTEYTTTIGGAPHTVVWQVQTISESSIPTPRFYEIDATANTLLQN